jgi:opine dehydrogenase
VAAALAAADAERLRVARTYGVAAQSLRAWIASAYGHHGGTIQAAVGGNPAYVGIRAPATMDHRYLLEDVPTGLIPLLELGTAAGLRLPTLQGLVDRARVALGGEPWDCPRTLDALGLDGLDTASVRTCVEYGFVPAERTAAPAFVSPLAGLFPGRQLIPTSWSGL